MKQYSRIEKFLRFLKSWYLCYFTPDAARKIQTSAPQPYLHRIGSNLNNVAQYMYRENKNDFIKILSDIQSKLPVIQKIKPLKMPNGQVVLQFTEEGVEEPFFSRKMSGGIFVKHVMEKLKEENSESTYDCKTFKGIGGFVLIDHVFCIRRILMYEKQY